MPANQMLEVEIKVTGHIDQEWSGWLGGLEIQHAPPNQTVLCGYLPDQAALFGIIARLRDLGLDLVSVHTHDFDQNI